jgi:D-alanine-D-alanine ligase
MSPVERLLRVAVIGGGESSEHDVSLASAASVVAALDRGRYVVSALTIDPDGLWRWTGGTPLGPGRGLSVAAAVRVLAGCDVVVPMVHGPLGEDGALAALCALAGVPVVGSPLGAGAIGMDKWATKAVARSVGVATADAHLLSVEADLRAVTVRRFPVVVKPVAAGSSHGVGIAHDADELRAAAASAFTFGGAVLVEEFVVGREIDVAVLLQRDGTLRIPPALEVRLQPGTVFDTAGKYDGSAAFVLPAPLTDADRTALEDAARRVFVALGCRGVARVDFFLTRDGPVLNEINTMPGFTDASQVPRMFAAADLPYPALLDELIAAALEDAQRGRMRVGRTESDSIVPPGGRSTAVRTTAATDSGSSTYATS